MVNAIALPLVFQVFAELRYLYAFIFTYRLLGSVSSVIICHLPSLFIGHDGYTLWLFLATLD